jgi:hypothetical protein
MTSSISASNPYGWMCASLPSPSGSAFGGSGRRAARKHELDYRYLLMVYLLLVAIDEKRKPGDNYSLLVTGEII